MDKKKLTAAAAAGVMLLICSLAVAYFTDYDTKTNVFTVGNVALELNEEHFTDGQLVRADVKLDKDPTVKNTGTNDEFVFLEVKVPKGEITLLGSDGRPSAAKSLQELFSFFGSSGAQAVSGSDNFAYNGSTSSSEGWVFLEKAAAANEDTYVFGYSTAVSPGEETISLFDKFALRKFIEEEIAGGTKLKIPVNAYGIQADSLDGVSGLTESGSLTAQDLKDIFEICRNKQN
jgi:predicted ribosomally synthesized peptide with SipW-like signal peptide